MATEPDTTKPEPRTTNCPDCGAGSGNFHIDGCDVARCTHTTNECNTRWTGRWTGETECIEYGFVIDLGPGTEPLPDLNRLYAERNWDPAQQRMVRRTT
ncbi:hypothetical protein ACH4VM_32425 [Streptomyces sp. NPDC020792]|uniref:hypothetical protein n=1 Tax=Streptomyces sp. NPDC020792 TaxID=3365089 RepID=UPI00378E2CCD